MIIKDLVQSQNEVSKEKNAKMNDSISN